MKGRKLSACFNFFLLLSNNTLSTNSCKKRICLTINFTDLYFRTVDNSSIFHMNHSQRRDYILVLFQFMPFYLSIFTDPMLLWKLLFLFLLHVHN